MPSGGHARSGPPPDPNALRRERDGHEWVALPKAGRKGRAPTWPLVKPSRRETTLWTRLWHTPQAVEWERQGQQLEVALYVRRLVECELPMAPSSLGTLVRQLGDSLGLSTPGLRSNRWRVVDQDQLPAPGRRAGTRTPVKRKAARDRFTVVTGDADGDGD
jgi:hypothetical protein